MLIRVLKSSHFVLSALIVLLSLKGHSFELGFNITETGTDLGYSSALTSSHPYELIDQAQGLGVKVLVFNIRAHMIGPRSSDIRSANPNMQTELEGLRKLISYSQEKGIKVGIRPIVLVMGPKGEFPYKEKNHIWWHGNIQPADPQKWFDSFEKFIQLYLVGLKGSKIDQWTLGAEMQSMMVGLGEDENAFRRAVPERWNLLFDKIKMQLPQAEVTYDINFPETAVVLTNSVGGEWERWRYGLTTLQNSKSSTLRKKSQALVQLWKKMDFIGLDFYRYLAKRSDVLPTNDDDLLNLLSTTALSHATQIDNSLFEIQSQLEIEKKVVIKEIGYKSIENSFINPALYSDANLKLNLKHQALAYKAIANSFVKPRWPWLRGIYFWDLSLDPTAQGAADNGFSPVGKTETEAILKLDFQGSP